MEKYLKNFISSRDRLASSKEKEKAENTQENYLNMAWKRQEDYQKERHGEPNDDSRP